MCHDVRRPLKEGPETNNAGVYKCGAWIEQAWLPGTIWSAGATQFAAGVGGRQHHVSGDT